MIIYDAVRLAFSMYEFVILVRVFMSWLPIDPYSKLARFISDLTDPYLGFIERFMPSMLLSPLNFTPVVGLFLLSLLSNFILKMLAMLLFSSSIPI